MNNMKLSLNLLLMFIILIISLTAVVAEDPNLNNLDNNLCNVEVVSDVEKDFSVNNRGSDDLIVKNISGTSNKFNMGDLNKTGSVKELMKVDMIDNSTFKITTGNHNGSIIMHNFDILSDDDFKKATKLVRLKEYNGNKLDYLVLNFKKEGIFSVKKEDKLYFNPEVNLIINGNNASVSVSNPDKSAECKFLLNNKHTIILNDLKISGFNTAIENHGILSLSNVLFVKNKIDYWFKQDYGGAIKNDGIVKAINCSFKDNYAKYGGAIYNRGILNMSNCTFEKNKGYGDGNNVYNFDKGVVDVTEGDGDIVFNKKGRSAFQKWALRIGVGALVVAAGIGLSLTGIGVPAAVALATVTGAILGAGEGIMEGYLDQDLSVDYVINCAVIYGSIGAIASSIASVSLVESELGVVGEIVGDGASCTTWSSSSVASSASSVSGMVNQAAIHIFHQGVIASLLSFTVILVDGIYMIVHYGEDYENNKGINLA